MDDKDYIDKLLELAERMVEQSGKLKGYFELQNKDIVTIMANQQKILDALAEEKAAREAQRTMFFKLTAIWGGLAAAGFIVAKTIEMAAKANGG